MSIREKGLPSRDSDKLDRQYANYIEVGFNAGEFVLDFGLNFENEEAELYTRIITSPRYAKNFLQLLIHAIGEYEMKWGPIPEEDLNSDNGN